MSDPVRGGPPAPTTTAAFLRAEVVRDALNDAGYEHARQITDREALAVSDAVLAAWIAGLTDTQLDEVTVDLESAMHHGWPHSATLLRAALTRLGGAHE